MLWHAIPPHFPPFPPRFSPFSPVFPRFSPFFPVFPHFPPFFPFFPFFRGPKKTWRLRGGRLPRPAKGAQCSMNTKGALSSKFGPLCTPTISLNPTLTLMPTPNPQPTPNPTPNPNPNPTTLALTHIPRATLISSPWLPLQLRLLLFLWLEKNARTQGMLLQPVLVGYRWSSPPLGI